MITERRIRTGAFLVGVLLYFTLKTAVESVFPYGKPLINLPQQLGFNILLSFLINLILGIGTQRINDGLEKRIPWQETATRRLIVQALVTGLFVLVMVSLFASVMIFVILPYNDPVESFIRAIVVGSVFAMVMSMFYTAVYFYEQWGRSRLEAEQLKRENLQSEIDAYGVRIQEDLRNRRARQEELAFLFARSSPAAAYQLAAMEIARTGIGIKNANEEAMERYRGKFKEHVDKKQKESGNTGGFRITVDSESGFSFSAPRERGTLDVSDLPRFAPVKASMGEILQSSLVDACLLALFGLLALGGAVFGFHRYDVR